MGGGDAGEEAGTNQETICAEKFTFDFECCGGHIKGTYLIRFELPYNYLIHLAERD